MSPPFWFFFFLHRKTRKPWERSTRIVLRCLSSQTGRTRSRRYQAEEQFVARSFVVLQTNFRQKSPREASWPSLTPSSPLPFSLYLSHYLCLSLSNAFKDTSAPSLLGIRRLLAINVPPFHASLCGRRLSLPVAALLSSLALPYMLRHCFQLGRTSIRYP